MWNQTPFADKVRIDAGGVRLAWHRECPESRYCGRNIPWSRVWDADPGESPPQLRLVDGRTVFISAEYREELATAVSDAGVPVVERYDVWGDLLQPFLDTDYDIWREECEQRLRSWGFSDQETRRIRQRVRKRMLALTLATWEWISYGQSDLLLATCPTPDPSYRRFRAWTDVVADRPYKRSGPSTTAPSS
ncbi:MAG TPA: hypothetical protein VFX60_09145 [Micromonospora sp.]|nr:hypothetical protein [Micromonospora sp.]